MADSRSKRIYNLPRLPKCVTDNFAEDHFPRYRLELQQQHMLFKSPSFSNHGGEIAMRLLQHCFQMRKLTIKTFSPLMLTWKRGSAVAYNAE